MNPLPPWTWIARSATRPTISVATSFASAACAPPVGAVVDLARALVDEQPRLLELGVRVDEHALHELVLADRLSRTPPGSFAYSSDRSSMCCAIPSALRRDLQPWPR